VQGSALDRLVSDKSLRARLTSGLADTNVRERLSTEGNVALTALDAAFREKGLPSNLDLAITGSQGIAVTALIGLTAAH
jgi:putative ATP-dependent endonuclease of OLD family